MDFYYNDNHGQIKKLDLKIGTQWHTSLILNSYINSIFKNIDDGDNKLSEKEFSILQYLLKSADGILNKKSKDGTVDDNELKEIVKKLKSNEIDLQELKNGRTDIINPDDHSLENLKKRYHSSLYTVEKYLDDCILVKNKKTVTLF